MSILLQKDFESNTVIVYVLIWNTGWYGTNCGYDKDTLYIKHNTQCTVYSGDVKYAECPLDADTMQ